MWVRESCHMSIRRVADNFVPHQRRSIKNTINQQRDGLLYGPRLTACGSVGEVERFIEQTRHKIIDELTHRKVYRDNAVKIANIVCKKALRKVT